MKIDRMSGPLGGDNRLRNRLGGDHCGPLPVNWQELLPGAVCAG